MNPDLAAIESIFMANENGENNSNGDDHNKNKIN
jgi:hypothetical protein